MKNSTTSALSSSAEKHLGSYALAAAAGVGALTAAQVAQAGVLSFTYSNEILAPGNGGNASFTLFAGGPTVTLDLNTSGTYHFAGINASVIKSGRGLYAANLGANAPISAGKVFKTGQSQVIGYVSLSASEGNFVNKTGFLGFRFADPTVGAQTDYGWVRIGEDAGQNMLTIFSAAYNDTGAGILAGQTSVPEPGSLGLLAGGAGLLGAWRARAGKRRAAVVV